MIRINSTVATNTSTNISHTAKTSEADAFGIFGPADQRTGVQKQAKRGKIAVKDFISLIDKSAREEDVVRIFSKLDSGNIRKMFNATTTEDGKHELIQKLYKKNISVKARNQILNKMLKASENDEKLQKSILSSAVYYSMNSNENNPELLSKLSKYNVGTCLIQFQHEAYANKKQNRTVKENSKFTSWKSWRAAATYSQTMPQAIVNNPKLSVTDKKNALTNILRATVEIAKYNNMNTAKIQRYYKAGLQTIQNYNYDSNTNADKLNIILDELCCNTDKIYDEKTIEHILQQEGGI